MDRKTVGKAATGSTVLAEQAGSGYDMGAPGGRPGNGETPLTGETAQKVTAAAQAEVPGGTVDRVETDSDGVYEAHVTKADGTQVIVSVDESFAVTNVQEMPVGMGGPGGTGAGPGTGETPLTGTKAAKVEAAAQEEIPGGTVTRVETDSEGVFEAHLTKQDGTEVVVQVNTRFEVTGVQEMPAPPDGAPGMPANSQPGTGA